MIEDLKSIGIENNSVDVIISNCVINLCPNKEQVFKEVARVLKPGGEIYFSDVYAEQDFPPHLKDDKLLWCEGFSGALKFDTFLTLVQNLGFSQAR